MDEKDLRAAQQAYTGLCQALEDIGYHYRQNDEDLDVHFEVHGDGLPMELTISIDGERDLIRLLSFLPFKATQARMSDVAVAVCKINDILINGNFDLGLEKGRLTFRMVQSYRDSLIDTEVFKYMIYVSLNTIDEYSEKLYMFSRGKITLDELEDSDGEEEETPDEDEDGDDGDEDAGDGDE